MMKVLLMTNDSDNREKSNIFFTIDVLKKSKDNLINRKKNENEMSIK